MASWTHDHAMPGARPDWPPLRPVALPLLVWALLLGVSVLQDLTGLQGDARVLLFDVHAERSFYTWFSQLMLAGAAVLLWDTGRKVAPDDRRTGMQWMLLGVLFFLLSADEMLEFHERMNALASIVGTSGYLAFAWVIPAALLCIGGFIVLMPFLRRLPVQVRNWMILSAAIFVGGALGAEAISAKLYSDLGDWEALSYRLATAVEEGLEGLGVLVFIGAVLLYRRKTGLARGIGSV